MSTIMGNVLSLPALWAVIGLGLCAAEMLAPGVFLLWIGLAAVATATAAEVFSLGWPAQMASFVAFALVLIAAVAMRKRRSVHGDTVNAPTAGLIGATCRALAFQAGEGRVSLRDGTWQARVMDGATPDPGEVLRVVGLDGTTLLVARPKPA